MRRNKNLILFFWLFLVSCAFSQETLNLNYAAYVDAVRKNNPLILAANNYTAIGRSQYEAARGNYDPVFNTSIDSKYFNKTNYYNIAEGSVKQPIFTSQYLKAGYEFGNGSYLNPEETTSTYGLPYLGVEASLLQGFLFDKRRADVLKAKGYVDFYKAEQLIQVNDLLYQSSMSYFEFLYAEKLLSLYTYFLSLANTRLRGIEDLANNGERPFVDTVEAAIFTQSRILDLQSANIEINKRQNELSTFIWSTDQIPTANAVVFVTGDSLDDSYERAKSIMLRKLTEDSLNNPILMQYRAKQKVLDVEQRLKKELIKPKLDVSYNLLSNNQDSYAPVWSTNNYKWGASLSFPLFLRNSRNEFKVAGLNARNNAFDLKYKENEIERKQNFLRQSTNVLILQLQNAERSAKYSKLLLEAERLKFENGESSVFMLNTRENKWLESELKLAEYKLKFIKNLLSVIHLNGNLNYVF